MICDIHAHHVPPTLERALANGPRRASHLVSRFPRPQLPFEHRLALMAEAGVERQVLSITSGYYRDDEAAGLSVTRGMNDEFSALCEGRPSQFSFWASLPLPHVDATLREIDRALALPGCVGFLLNCFILGRSLADEIFEPVYAELNRRRAVVLLHPAQNGLATPLINDWGLAICVGTAMEDSLAALHLIQRQIPLRYPAIQFIVPHFGGMLPMLLNRLDGQMPQDGFAEAPSATARRFFYDTVGWGSKAALIAAVEAFGPSQLVTGSDYPVLLPWESYSQSFQHIREAGLAAEVADRILHHNAAALLGLR